MGELDGKVAVITAATSGMALATRKALRRRRCLRLHYRTQPAAPRRSRPLHRPQRHRRPERASNLADLDCLFDQVKKEKGRIDVFFASAGYGDSASIRAVTQEQFDNAFNTNVRGTLFTVQKALPLMPDESFRLHGQHQGFPDFSVYNVSKAAVRSFARTWLVDLKERMIRVNVLSTGAPHLARNVPYTEHHAAFPILSPKVSMKRPALLLALSLCLPVTLHADDASKQAKVRELFALLHVEHISDQIRSSVMNQTAGIPKQLFGPEISPENKAKFDVLQEKILQTVDAQVGWKVLEPQYVRLYSDTYTEEEINGIVAFYKTPAGAAMIAKSPELSAKSIQVVQSKMAAVQPQLKQMVEDFVRDTKPASTPTAPAAAPTTPPPATTPK